MRAHRETIVSVGIEAAQPPKRSATLREITSQAPITLGQGSETTSLATE